VQAAYLTKHPAEFATSFWSSLPEGTFFPMFILATLASIIASQALISAAFQIVKQAIAQGFFPRFTVIHTSQKVPPFSQPWQPRSCTDTQSRPFSALGTPLPSASREEL